MELFGRQRWINFLALLPGLLLTVLTISVAFLRFYDEQDFSLLGLIAQPRAWSNRLTVAALLVAVVNFCVEWDRRNRETSRFAETEIQRAKEAARAEAERVEEGKRRAQAERRRAQEERRRAQEERRRAQEERRRAEAERRRAEAERRAENQRTQEGRRRAQEEVRRAEAERRAENQRAEEGKRAARRARVQARCTAAQIRFQIDPSLANREFLSRVLVFIEEYGDTL